MIHIVFNEADIDVLKKAIEMDETMQGDVLQVKDDYAVGPLTGIYEQEGIEARKQWWRELLTGGDYAGLVEKGDVDDTKLVADLKERLQAEPAELIWIWAAQNSHDVSGYYWLMSQLKDFQGRVFILYLNNLPFFNEKGSIFYPNWLSVIPPREFIKAKRLLTRVITLSEFEIDPDEWTRICNEGKDIRILEGGKKLAQYGHAFYDEELRKFITTDWQKASKIINQYINKGKHYTGDAYLLWRLKGLITSGELDAQGEIKNMKDFEVKKKAGQTEIIMSQE